LGASKAHSKKGAFANPRKLKGRVWYWGEKLTG
jgi:hypothetical protein